MRVRIDSRNLPVEVLENENKGLFSVDSSLLEVHPDDISGEWFLGYDGNCPRCAGIQELVFDVADGVISTVNLHDPVVVAWRRDALGENPPWTPTLFRLRDGRVEAWTGKKMAVRLASLIGPRRAWQLAEGLAERESSPGISNAIGRRGFLKGLTGVAAGFSMLKVAETDASAGSWGQCGYTQESITFGHGSRIVTSTFPTVNCRFCPGGAYVTSVNTGSTFHFNYRRVHSDGWWWYHSSGPTGCWVSGSVLS